MSVFEVFSLPAFLEIVSTKLRPHDAIRALGSIAAVTRHCDVGYYYEEVSRIAAPTVPIRYGAKSTVRELCKVASYIGLPTTLYPQKIDLISALDGSMHGKPVDVPPAAWEIAQAARDARARANEAPTSGFASNYYSFFDDVDGPLITASGARRIFLLTDGDLENAETLHYVNRYGTPSRMFERDYVTALAYEKHGGYLGLLVARELFARKRQTKAGARRRHEYSLAIERYERERRARYTRADEIREELEAIPDADVDSGIARWLLCASDVSDPCSHPGYWIPARHAARMLHKYAVVAARLSEIGERYDRIVWREFVIRDEDLSTDEFERLTRAVEETTFFADFCRMGVAANLVFASSSDRVDQLAQLWTNNGGGGTRRDCATKVSALWDFVRIVGKSRALELVPNHLRDLACLMAEKSLCGALKRKRDDA